MDIEKTVTIENEKGETVVFTGSYRNIVQKMKNILLSRPDKSFFVRTIQDKSGMAIDASYTFTDIANFLRVAELELIPKEENEAKMKNAYGAVRVFQGNRW